MEAEPSAHCESERGQALTGIPASRIKLPGRIVQAIAVIDGVALIHESGHLELLENLGRIGAAGAVDRDPQAKAAGRLPVGFDEPARENSQRDQLIVRGEELPLQPAEVLRPLLVPGAEGWRAGGVDGARAGIE
jgi:hypothetical protein